MPESGNCEPEVAQHQFFFVSCTSYVVTSNSEWAGHLVFNYTRVGRKAVDVGTCRTTATSFERYDVLRPPVDCTVARLQVRSNTADMHIVLAAV